MVLLLEFVRCLLSLRWISSLLLVDFLYLEVVMFTEMGMSKGDGEIYGGGWVSFLFM